MLRMNYRCVESMNISVEVSKMWKIFTNSPITLTFCLLQKNDLSWLNNLFMVSFQLIKISSYAKYKQQMCWVTQYHCRSRRMWNIFTNSPSTLTFCLLQKMTTLAWTIYSWLAFNTLGCPLSQRINYRCVESLEHQCRSRQMWKIFTYSTQYTLFLFLIENDLSWLNNPFMVSFQLISMSSYVKNKQQMCRFTQHQCYVAKCGKYFTNSPSTLTICLFMVRFQLIRMSSYAKN